MAKYGIPWTTYYKVHFRRKQEPNIFRDDARNRLDGVVYANKDYIFRDEPKVKVRKYDQLEGGIIPKQLELPWNYPPITEDEEILEHISACEINEPLFRPDFPLSDKRYHIRLTSGRRQAYLPSMTPIVTVPSEAGNMIVTTHHNFTLPDYPFVKDTQQGLMMWFNGSSQNIVQVSSIFVNPCLVNLRFVPSDVRDSMIRHLAKVIKNQKNLEQLTFENAFLYCTDAIRIVVAAALGAGGTLQKVYFGNLFSSHILPIETESEFGDAMAKTHSELKSYSKLFFTEHLVGTERNRAFVFLIPPYDPSKVSLKGHGRLILLDLDIYDEFEYDSKDVPEFSDETKSNVWDTCLERACFHELSLSKVDTYFQLALSSFTNLTVLMVNYTWLSKGNGLYLLRLGSIRNGKLRKLILILSPPQHPSNSKQIICNKAWIEALKLCPDLELHMILSQNVCHMKFTEVFVRCMPLVSVHLSSIYPVGDLNKQKPWFFSYTTRFFWSYFSHTLKMITLEVWLPTTRVDVSISNLILKCPYLQVFLYRGHLDKIDTIHTLLEFLIDAEPIRLREISFFLADDACRPIGWSEALEEAKKKYQVPLALKGIYLHLGVWKF